MSTQGELVTLPFAYVFASSSRTFSIALIYVKHNSFFNVCEFCVCEDNDTVKVRDEAISYASECERFTIVYVYSLQRLFRSEDENSRGAEPRSPSTAEKHGGLGELAMTGSITLTGNNNDETPKKW